MNLRLNNGWTVRDLWVFDDIVAVRLTNSQVVFYEKPLIAGNYADPIVYFTEEEEDISPDVVAYEFAVDAKTGNYDMFAVTNSTLHRYRFIYEERSSTVEMQAF